jgi:hypothetical protein
MNVCALWFACLVFVVAASGADRSRASIPPDNKELERLFMDDQHDRGNEPVVEYDEHGKRITPVRGWKQLPDRELRQRDAARQTRLREILNAGLVQTAQDYTRAALIFQHGESSDDYLLAHILAVAAVSKGEKNARWIAAATLDRYLQSLKQPQVFGTQFVKSPTGEMTQGDYRVDLLSNSVRAAMCVRAREKQEQQVKAARQNPDKADYITSIISCP